MQARGCLTSSPCFFKHPHQTGMEELGNLRAIFPLVCVFKGIIKDLLSAFLFPLFSSLIFPVSFPLPFPSVVSISLWLLFLCGALWCSPLSSLFFSLPIPFGFYPLILAFSVPSPHSPWPGVWKHPCPPRGWGFSRPRCPCDGSGQVCCRHTLRPP